MLYHCISISVKFKLHFKKFMCRMFLVAPKALENIVQKGEREEEREEGQHVTWDVIVALNK